jgi:hypothetical protein
MILYGSVKIFSPGGIPMKPGRESEKGRHNPVVQIGNINRRIETRLDSACLNAAEPQPTIVPARGGPSMTG